MEENNNMQLQPAPNGGVALTMGILSLVFGCGVIGFIFSIIGLSKAKKGLAVVNQNPAAYTGAGMLKAGKIMSIIGIVISAIGLVYWIVVLAAAGGAVAAMSY